MSSALMRRKRCSSHSSQKRLHARQEDSQETETQLNHDFDNCCNNELISILHGELYRCPFSANATNLKAIPKDESDIVNLNKPKNKNSTLRDQIYNLCYNKEFLTACNYCNGRDYTTKWIKAAEQTKKPLDYKEYN